MILFLNGCGKTAIDKRGHQLPLLVITLKSSAITRSYTTAEAILQIKKDTQDKDQSIALSQVQIKIRGQSSARFPKKSYALKFITPTGKKRPIQFLDLPSGSHWVLHGPYLDKSLMRNALAYRIMRLTGNYAPRTRFIELWIEQKKQNSGYQGIYLLVEKIRRSRHRIAIPKWNTARPFSKRGFIIEFDRSPKNKKCWKTSLGTRFLLHYPAIRKTSLKDKQNIIALLDTLEQQLYLNDIAKHPDPAIHKILDLDALADYLLLNSLFLNKDAFVKSTYVYHNGYGKLVYGPVWDFNLACGNFMLPYHTGWTLFPKPLIRKLLMVPLFRKRLRLRWNRLRKTAFTQKRISKEIDTLAKILNPAVSRNFKRWKILDKNLLRRNGPFPRSFKHAIDRLQRWLKARLAWMDIHINHFWK